MKSRNRFSISTRTFSIASLCLLLLSVVTHPASAEDARTVEQQAEAIKAHVKFLADDLLEGRDAGTPGYDIAALYVATQLQGLGIKPASPDGWYQPVPFVRNGLATDKPGIFRIGDMPVENTMPRFSRAGDIAWNGNVVFAGYGMKSPVNSLNEFAGLDVRGKIVVAFEGEPGGLKPDPVIRSFDMYKELGAAGLILVQRTAEAKKNAENSSGAPRTPSPGRPMLDIQPPPAQSSRIFEITLSPSQAAKLFEGAPVPFAQLLAKADKGERMKGFALKPKVSVEGNLSTQRFKSANILGVIPGGDPELANEFVLLMAHLDHLGPKKVEVSKDGISNGALDNAVGIATLIETARIFMTNGRAARRSILIAAVTAEEDGLLGSKWLADHPIPGASNIVAVVNLDMPVLLYDFTDVTAFGAEHSTLGGIAEKAVAAEGVKLSPDPQPKLNIFQRSDHYSFVKRGVPSIFLMTGFANGGKKAFNDFMATHYHKPGDDLSQQINWAAGAKFTRVNYAIAEAIANADTVPRWYADSPVGKEFAKDQPKAEPVIHKIVR